MGQKMYNVYIFFMYLGVNSGSKLGDLGKKKEKNLRRVQVPLPSFPKF